MRRFAAHYIWYQQVYTLHYIEVNDAGEFVNIFPLKEEIAGTTFQDGVLIPLPINIEPDIQVILKNWRELTGKTVKGSKIYLYRLSGLSPATAKLGTNDGCSNCNIERL